MRSALTTWLLLLGLGLLSACRPTGAFRVVDLPEPPPKAMARVTHELESKRYRVVSTERKGNQVTLTVEVQPPRPAPPKAPPKKKRARTPPKAPPAKKQAPTTTQGAAKPKRAQRLTVTLAPHLTGTRVLMRGPAVSALPAIFDAHESKTYRPSFGLNGHRLLWEVHGASGYRYAPGFGPGLSLEGGSRLGYRFLHLGGGRDGGAPTVSVGVAAGIGVGWHSPQDSYYAMPTLTLSALIRRTVEPLPGKVIPLGPEFAVDLHAVGLFGPDRSSVEGQLVFRYGDIIGAYVGVGHQWLPERGTTFTFGLYLSTIGVATVAAIAAALASL